MPGLIGKKIGMTDYRISAIPLGGYVKMSGADNMADPTGAPPDSFVAKRIRPCRSRTVISRWRTARAGRSARATAHRRSFWNGSEAQ